MQDPSKKSDMDSSQNIPDLDSELALDNELQLK